MRHLTFFGDFSSRGSLQRQISLPAAWRRFRRTALGAPAPCWYFSLPLCLLGEWWSGGWSERSGEEVGDDGWSGRRPLSRSILPAIYRSKRQAKWRSFFLILFSNDAGAWVWITARALQQNVETWCLDLVKSASYALISSVFKCLGRPLDLFARQLALRPSLLIMWLRKTLNLFPASMRFYVTHTYVARHMDACCLWRYEPASCPWTYTYRFFFLWYVYLAQSYLLIRTYALIFFAFLFTLISTHLISWTNQFIIWLTNRENIFFCVFFVSSK